MKKKLFSLIVALAFVIALIPAAAFAKTATEVKAEGDELAFWNFEEAADINDWTFVDADGDGKNWYRSYNTNASNYGLCSQSYSSGALTPDNWAITPAVVLPEEEGLTLSYKVMNSMNSYPEKYQVYVGTSNAIEDMVAITELITVSGGSYYVEQHDLADYKGQTVYIAFRHHGVTDMYNMYIDEVRVTVGEPAAPQKITEVYIENYDSPLEGEVAADHLNLTVSDDSNCRITQQFWYQDGFYTAHSGEFQAGVEYFMRIVLTPDEGYEFDNNVKIFINGSPEYVDWGIVSGTNYSVYTIPEVCEALPTLLGDADLDDDVDVDDVNLTLRAALGLVEFDEEQIGAADVNGDGEIGLEDAILILRYVLGIIESFPIEAE